MSAHPPGDGKPVIPFEDKLLSSIETIYVGTHTHFEENCGYTERSKHILTHLNKSVLLLNPFIHFNKKHIGNKLIIKDNLVILLFSKERITRFLLKHNVKNIICASDATNYLTFTSHFRHIIRLRNIMTIYEVRGIWYKSRDAGDLYHNRRIDVASNRKLESLELEALRRSDKVVFITDQVRDYFLRLDHRLMRKKNVIIHNCASPRRTNNNGSNTRNAPFTIGYAGSMYPYEGIGDLINVVESIYLINRNIRLRLIGRVKNSRVNFKKEFIRYSPWVNKEDLDKEMRDWDLYCIARRNYEVCNLVSPLKPFDALSKKIPLLMPDCDCLKDISDSGRRCMLFKKGNLQDLRQKILRVMGDGYPAQLLENGYNFIENERNWACEISKYNKFVERT